MRRTRFMSLFFLALSLAFFCVEDFRWALGYMKLELTINRIAQYGGPLPPEEVRTFAQQAQQKGDAEALAFAALYTPDREESFRLAEQAVAKDPKLSWVYYHVAKKNLHSWEAPEPAVAKRFQDWIQKLEAFDPDNAVPSILRAELIRAESEASTKWPYIIPTDQKSLEFPLQHPDWLAAMDRAFDRPRYDSYSVRRFELERRLWARQGWARPGVVVPSLWFYPIPDLLNLRSYTNFRVFYRGRQAEQAGRREEALGHYYAATNFANRMRLGGNSLIEELIGMALDRLASEPLQAALEKAGRKQEALSVSQRLADYDRVWGKPKVGRDPLRSSSNRLWSALQMAIFSLLVVLFAAVTLVSVLYVNAKRWIRPEKRGHLYALVTVLENYAPILLFASCLALYLIYAPYAQNFHFYMTATGPIRSLEPIGLNVYPLISELVWWPNELAPENPFGNYIYWALGFLGLAVLLGAWGARQARRASSKTPRN